MLGKGEGCEGPEGKVDEKPNRAIVFYSRLGKYKGEMSVKALPTEIQ